MVSNKWKLYLLGVRVLCIHSSASGRIIGAKDHASIQINIADVS